MFELQTSHTGRLPNGNLFLKPGCLSSIPWRRADLSAQTDFSPSKISSDISSIFSPNCENEICKFSVKGSPPTNGSILALKEKILDSKFGRKHTGIWSLLIWEVCGSFPIGPVYLIDCSFLCFFRSLDFLA